VRSVLVIHSTQDESVDDRIRAMANDPELKNVSWHHTYFILRGDGEAFSSMRPPEFLEQNQDVILRRFSDLAESANPDLIVLHTGVAFYIAPSTVLSIMHSLKQKFPGPTFAIQKGRMFSNVLTSRDHNVRYEVNFAVNRIFDQSPEVQQFVDGLF